jgi:UDP-N-acetylmuramate dehydrogenase
MEFNLKKRKNQPEEPSAGCIFKNVEIKNFPQLKEIFKTYGDLKNIIKDGKIPAGWLIEKCGLKGKKIGQAKISEKHANFIVNLGKAKANDVLKLIDLIKKEVENKFKIRLEEEIEIVC